MSELWRLRRTMHFQKKLGRLTCFLYDTVQTASHEPSIALPRG